jgi:hypothetical protein
MQFLWEVSMNDKCFRWSKGLVSFCVSGWILTSGASIGANETVSFREVFHGTKYEEVEVGDEPGHVLATGEGRGLAFFPNGEVATSVGVFTGDFREQESTVRGYETFTFVDGSTQVIQWEGTVKQDKSGKSVRYEGRFSYVKGTGRFAGITGGGTYTGRGFDVFAPGAGGYDDYVGSYELPPR